MRRRSQAVGAVGCLALAMIVGGCLGDSDDAAYITANSAVLRGHGKCNNSQYDATHGNCYHYWQIREKGTSNWLARPASSNCPAEGAPALDNGVPNDSSIVWNLSCTWTNLASDKVYEFQFCGGDGGGAAYCASTRSFTTATFDNPVTQPCEGLHCFIAPRMGVAVGAPRANAFDGGYYLTGSGHLVDDVKVPQDILTSSDLVEWTSLGRPTFANARTDGTSRPLWASNNNDSRNGSPQHFVNISWWGTELHKVPLSTGGAKYILVSSFDYDIGTKTQSVIGLATADNVTGPYTWLASPVDVPNQNEQHIDPSIFVDGNKIWLLHNINGSALAIVQLDAATLARKSTSQKVLLKSSLQPRNYEYDGDADGREEGPGMIKAPDGTYVLYYATGASDWEAPDSYQYTVGLARGSSANGSFEKIPDAQLPDGRTINSIAEWKGAGHGGIVSDGAGHFWWVYHSTRPADIYHTRMTMVQQIFWDPSARWFFFEGNSIRISDVAAPLP